MHAFNNLNTKSKLLLSFGAIQLLLVVVGVLSVVAVMQLSQRVESIFKINVVPLKQLGELQGRSQRMSALIAWHILATDSATMKKWADEIKKLDEEIDKFEVDYAPIIMNDGERKMFERFHEAWAGYKEVRTAALKKSADFSKDAASEIQNKELAEKLSAMLGAVAELVKENESQAQENHESSKSMAWMLAMVMIVVIVGALAIGLLGSWAVTKFVVTGLENLLEATKQLRSGNLAYRATVRTEEEIGQLAQAFNAMGAQLEETVENQEQEIASKVAEVKGITDAIGKSQAVIEFQLDGTVLTANENFLQTLGYRLDEITGRHHRMFCSPAYAQSAEYQAFWAKLNRGEFDAGVYPRLRKDGQDIWIQATYNPILDRNGKVYKVVKYAMDITEQQRKAVEFEGTIKAAARAQAVVEFRPDGTVITANENFLQTLGYRLDEITGRHHRMFCSPAYAQSAEYQVLWTKLNRGEFDMAVYPRLRKDGQDVWLQASYNPILDAHGKVYKVVKYATDITAQKTAQVEMEQLVTESQAVLGKLAANDLTQPMTGTYQGELAKIKASINAVVQNLTQTITTVREAVEAVTTGAEEITKGSEDLSQRTSEQAGSLEETSASMEEMTSTVKQNADNAKQANQLAITARDTADKGGVVTKKAVEAMGEINKSSKKIADIITVIDEIAFQTNLLALNAAVEAARAGEHGRGFAVVAAEVRNLAQRSATAAKEIKGLINESIQRVTDGSELVDQSGKTLEEIVHSVKRVTDIIEEITAASQEQASGIDQVNKAILAMDESTQQNAALVEETTSAAQSMKGQAKELMRQVEAFKVQGAAGGLVMSGPSSTGRSASVASSVRSVTPRKATRTHDSIGVGSPNGKDRHGTGDEFEEF
ncbi:methyl-accepting chemotaxis protein [Nitrospira sp. CMX1]